MEKLKPSVKESEHPEILIKVGGINHGTYYEDQNVLTLCYFTWSKLKLFQKRMLIIHELMHFLGLNHSTELMYDTSVMDVMSFSVYKIVFGNDQCLEEAENFCRTVIMKMIM